MTANPRQQQQQLCKEEEKKKKKKRGRTPALSISLIDALAASPGGGERRTTHRPYFDH